MHVYGRIEHEQMNSKKRVHAALRREPVDRVPVYMWFHPDTAHHISDLLEIPVNYLGDAMGNDVRQTWINNNYAMEGITHEHNGEGHIDFWGIKWVKEGAFNQPVGFPLTGAGKEELLSYKFPNNKIDFLLNLMGPVLEQQESYFIGCDVSPCVFEMYWRLRGLENALADIIADTELSRTMFKRCAHFALTLARKACSAFPLDWLWTGDDIAGQTSLIISPESWRELIKPLLAEIFAVGKSHGLWVAFHSCGAVRPIIPDLIEIGLDVLNPVQSNCPGMDPLELKKEFGKELSFMGGVDTQKLLPFGTVDEVRRSIAKLLDGMTSDGGGFILAASHSIPPETPAENIFAMYEEAGITKEEIFDRAASIRAGLDHP